MTVLRLSTILVLGLSRNRGCSFGDTDSVCVSCYGIPRSFCRQQCVHVVVFTAAQLLLLTVFACCVCDSYLAFVSGIVAMLHFSQLHSCSVCWTSTSLRPSRPRRSVCASVQRNVHLASRTDPPSAPLWSGRESTLSLLWWSPSVLSWWS